MGSLGTGVGVDVQVCAGGSKPQEMAPRADGAGAPP